MPKWDFNNDPGLSAPHFEGQEIEQAARAIFARTHAVTPGSVDGPWGEFPFEHRLRYTETAKDVLRSVFPGATFYTPPPPDKDVS